MNQWKLSLRRRTPASQIVYFLENPQGGGFGSNLSHNVLRSAECHALRVVPAGDRVTVENYVAGRLLSTKIITKE